MENDESLYRTLRIEAILEIINDFKVFVFEEGHGLKYKAGQYITLVHFSNGIENRRSYSIISAPNNQEKLMVGIKRIANGLVSRRLLDHAKVGDEILTTGIGGFFTLPQEIENFQQVYFLAAGSGITPCLSLIKCLLFQHPQTNVVLVYSNTSPQTAAFKTDLELLKEKYSSRFNVEFLYSESQNLSRARLYPDLLRYYVKNYGVTHPHKMLFYICGPVIYMDMCTFTLQADGIPKENIRKEDFVIEGKNQLKILPPDKNSYQVNVRYGKNSFSLKLEFPDSILRTAKKQNISLPYSCESGRCGSCVAKLISGNIWHSNNEVLTDREIEQGLVLTCVGHPVGGDVEIEI